MKKIIFALLLALPMTVFAQKLGHVNSNDIMQAMPEVATLQKDMEALQKQYADELKRREDQLQADNEAYEKEKAGLSETLKQFREQKLQKDFQDYQQFAKTCDNDYKTQYQTKLQAIQEKVLAAVNSVGEAEGCAYVFDAQTIPFIGASATDLTAKVKTALGIK